jgi:DNA polymerase-3 subunit alpha
MAALLTIESQSSDKVALYLAECRELDVPVLPPDINRSRWAFVVEPEGVRFGLGAIKGAGEGAIQSLVAAREALGGRVKSLFELAEHIDLRLVNKKVLECLIKAGAFDSLAPGGQETFRAWRPRLLNGLDRILDHGDRHQRERIFGQGNMFAGSEPDSGGDIDDTALPAVNAWTEAEALAAEKEALGLYMTGHPLQRYADAIAATGAKRVMDLAESLPDVAVAGIVAGLRPLKTKKGDRMAVFSLEDEAAKVEAVVFPEAFSRFGGLVANDAMLLVRGKYDRDDESSRLVVSEITPLDAVRERAVRQVEIVLANGTLGRTAMRELANILDQHPGDRPVSLIVNVHGAGHGLRVRTATARRIRPSDGFVRDVEAVCGAGAVVLK